MGLFKRLHRVTVGRIQAFLQSVEDPEIVFPQLLREMEGQLRQATETEAKCAASVKMSERAMAKTLERIEKMGRGAALAVKEGDDKTAREAVVAQIEAEEGLEEAQGNLARAKGTLDQASSARKQIQQQLEELRSKKDDIIARARLTKARKKIQQTVSGTAGSTDSILDAVARLEAGVEETEAELAIQARLVGASPSSSLEYRLDELDRKAEIDQRLAALRRQADLEPSGGSEDK